MQINDIKRNQDIPNDISDKDCIDRNVDNLFTVRKLAKIKKKNLVKIKKQNFAKADSSRTDFFYF